MFPKCDDLLIKRFEQPDEVRTFEKGRFEIVKIGSMTIGRASYEPGWKWSVHVGPVTGASSCVVGHIGLVVSGCAACRMNDGRYNEMKAGDLFYIGPGHDSWVVGDEPYVSLHFLGAEHYAHIDSATLSDKVRNV
jgi:quercetin dioxygenase-like cupin family protein